ncbi:hypothetical protein [Nicoletella semolina]|uniref:hypothetical protein n=1 Tax=Nicoletella semolina TaxID=271160 RepID=UPI00244B3F9E|nr:hypothetical protein [Nicoletella semolina]
MLLALPIPLLQVDPLFTKDELEKFALQLNDIAGVKSDLKLRASPQAGKNRFTS